MNKLHIVGGVIILVLAFYGGTKVGGGDDGAAHIGQGQFGDREGRRGPGGRFSGDQDGVGFAGGTILSVDENGITVELPDGGSRIVFISDGTDISKSAEGTREDLIVGEQVVITGQTNDDGSVSAESVRIGGADFRGFQRPDGAGDEE